MTNPLLIEIFALAKTVIKKAVKADKTIGTAESCTGGLIGAAITSISGASSVFKGGIISYDNSVKTSQLNVAAELIETHGAVSEEVAKAMALGALNQLGIDMALSITGIAGPGGGTDQKPVGTVWLGLAKAKEEQNEVFAKRLDLGDIGRNRVRDVSVLEALKLIDQELDQF